MAQAQLLAAYQQVRQQIADSLQAAERPADSLTCIAVSKQQPIEAIACLYEAGQRDFGENEPLALAAKAAALAPTHPGIRWHLLGTLQRNKLGKVLPWLHMIHSVDREPVLASLQRHAATHSPDVALPYCLQLNLAGEPQKSGCSVAELPLLLASASRYPHVHCCGLMIIPEQHADPRPAFEQLAQVLVQARQLPGGSNLRHLSMGMSSDFVAAIAAGATMVRIGRAIFGARGE